MNRRARRTLLLTSVAVALVLGVLFAPNIGIVLPLALVLLIVMLLAWRQ